MARHPFPERAPGRAATPWLCPHCGSPLMHLSAVKALEQTQIDPHRGLLTLAQVSYEVEGPARGRPFVRCMGLTPHDFSYETCLRMNNRGQEEEYISELTDL
jgi:hypothetical protein